MGGRGDANSIFMFLWRKCIIFVNKTPQFAYRWRWRIMIRCILKGTGVSYYNFNCSSKWAWTTTIYTILQEFSSLQKYIETDRQATFLQYTAKLSSWILIRDYGNLVCHGRMLDTQWSIYKEFKYRVISYTDNILPTCTFQEKHTHISCMST